MTTAMDDESTMTESNESTSGFDNQHVAGVLRRISEMLEFQGENEFKLRAFRMAAENIESMETPVAEMVAQGGAAELQKIPGIGKAISSQIAEIVQTGKSVYFEELTRVVPASVLDLRRIPGVGLKTAQLLYRDFAVKSLAELKTLADTGGLKSVPGLGEKTISRIKSSLERLLEEDSGS
jgi:DNA polymerase (family 10)